MLKLFAQALCCIAIAVIQTMHPVAAQSWPARPIKLVVPYPPGGSTDVTARLVAENLRPLLGQSVVIENKPGAGANLGADFVAKAAPDGYTLLMATSTHATNPGLYKDLPYDFVRDLAPVAQTAFIPNALVVTQTIPVANLADFVGYARNPKNIVNYGSAGNGSSQHLSAALFNSMAGAHMVHVPYKGGAPATVDLIGGQIQVYFGPLVEVIAHIKAGKIKALGMTTKKRSPLLPEVPTIGELLPGYEIALWNGILAPDKTPADTVQRLNQAILKVLDQADIKARFAEQGSEPAGNSPEEFRRFIGMEVEKWKTLVNISGAKVE